MLNTSRTGASPFGGSQTYRVSVKEEVGVVCGRLGLKLLFQGFDLVVSAAELGGMRHSLAAW